jgi:hypothetical protein
MIRVLLLLALIPLAAACAGREPADFAGKEPRLVPEQFFAGPTRGWGMIEDRFGGVLSQFTVELNGRWDGQTLILDEDFLYDSGRTQKRQWRFVKTGPDTYEGRAADVPGVALGTMSGNSFNLRYPLVIPRGDGTLTVDVDDWLFLQPGGVAINRAALSKFGVGVGEITLFIQRR